MIGPGPKRGGRACTFCGSKNGPNDEDLTVCLFTTITILVVNKDNGKLSLEAVKVGVVIPIRGSSILFVVI